MDYEGALIRVLSSSDQTAAGSRLLAMTEEEAARVLSRLTSDRREQKDPALLAKLTRDTLPEKRRLEIFSEEASRLSANYADVTGYLEQISATPAERDACVQSAAETRMDDFADERSVTTEEVEAMRTWAEANQVTSVDKLTGKALGNAADGDGGMTFDQAVALVMHYHEKSANDDLLVGFLESDVRCSLEKAHALLEKISDPVRRAEALKSIR